MSDYFISRDGQQMLVELLREIPGLVEDLAVTICRLDRTGKGGIKVSSGSDEQPLPINMAASDAKDELHNELASWARHVCESRGIAYDGDGSVLGIARWLDENVISLAMTEGSEEAYVSIEKAMGRCRRAMDIAPEDDHVVSTVEVEMAREARVTAADAERLMPKLGHPKLKAATIRKWVERGKLYRHPSDEMFRLGDILDLNPIPPEVIEDHAA